MLDDLVPNEESDAERDLAPSVDVPDESDADPRLQRQFWLLVLVFNVALMALSVGAMLAVFRAQWDVGTSLVAAGLILTAYGYYKYRVYEREEAEARDADATAAGDEEAGAEDHLKTGDKDAEDSEHAATAEDDAAESAAADDVEQSATADDDQSRNA